MPAKELSRSDRDQGSGGHLVGNPKSNLIQLVRQHYQNLWGEPSRTAHFKIMGKETDLYKWDANLNPEGVYLYATAGMSEYPLVDYDPKHRLELYTGLLPERDH